MQIKHLSTHDITGGAARSAYRLHSGLRSLGHDSLMLVAQKRSNDPTVIQAKLSKADSLSWFITQKEQRFRGKMGINIPYLTLEHFKQSRPIGSEYFSDVHGPYRTASLSQLSNNDIIHLHWIADFVNIPGFLSSAALGRYPVIWTLHDMNAFTGGCHFDFGCAKYMDECGECPQLGSNRFDDLSKQIWHTKSKVYAALRHHHLKIVAPSQWLANACRRSPLLGSFPVSVIPYGVDIHTFSPRSRECAREVLDLPLKSHIVLFSADAINNERKGFGLLLKALSLLKESPDLYLASMGKFLPSLKVPIPHIHLGHVQDDRLLSLIYSAADIFVIPSLQDNLPNTVMEAMACGVPVVGFNVGGIPDMVRPDITGLLVPEGDITGMSTMISRLLDDDVKRKRLGDHCREVAVKEYALEEQAGLYVELYRDLIHSA